MAIRDTLRNINWVMFVSLSVLLLFSVIFVGSAAFNIKEGDFKNYINKQCIWILLGLIVFLATLRVNYRTFHDYAYLLYGIGIVLTLIPFLLPAKAGVNSWIDFKFFSFQPSELMKICYVIALARLLKNLERRENMTSDLLTALALTALPVGIIMMQPDLGTAAVFIPVFFIMVFMAGVQLKYIAWATVAVLIVAPLSYFAAEAMGMGLLSDYQKKRITAFLEPEAEELGVAYQSYQSLAAIGSGRMLGRGLGNGLKTQFNQLPEKHTDFIVSVVAEEGGFVAVFFLLGAFYVFLFAAFMTAHNAPDTFGRLVVIGIIGIVSTQILINIGVAVSLLPITGITLPFISYGGSSMLSSFIAIGVVMSVGKEKKPYFT